MRSIVVTVAALFALSLAIQTASSQVPPPQEHPHHHMPLPDKFTNLQVLPKDISKEQLVHTMRMFSRSLGVRCDHCHEVSPEHADWASDKKDAKNAARNMLRMVKYINANYMPKSEPLPGEQSSAKVNCWTCHRGQKQPAQGPPPEQQHEGPPPPGMGPSLGAPQNPPA